jgi:hypothetical protein
LQDELEKVLKVLKILLHLMVLLLLGYFDFTIRIKKDGPKNKKWNGNDSPFI